MHACMHTDRQIYLKLYTYTCIILCLFLYLLGCNHYLPNLTYIAYIFTYILLYCHDIPLAQAPHEVFQARCATKVLAQSRGAIEKWWMHCWPCTYISILYYIYIIIYIYILYVYNCTHIYIYVYVYVYIYIEV